MAARRVAAARSVFDSLSEILPLLRRYSQLSSASRALASARYSPSSRTGQLAGVRRAADVGILLLVPKVEAEVVDDEAHVLLDVGTLVEIAIGGFLTQLLEPDDVVGVGGGR